MRIAWLDSLRGVAVIWMIIFHFTYDLTMFDLIELNMSQGFWYAFPRLIAGTFLFCVGISLNLVHRPQINTKALIERTWRLGVCALLISLGTYFAFPSQWIYFGTLHCILFGSLFGAFFVNHRAAAWTVMLGIFCAQYFLAYDITWVSSLTQRHSMDFIPIYPWFWVVLAGVVSGPYLARIPLLQKVAPSKFLHLLGRHSLKIYLLHQPILFALLWLFVQVSSVT